MIWHMQHIFAKKQRGLGTDCMLSGTTMKSQEIYSVYSQWSLHHDWSDQFANSLQFITKF